MESRAGHRWLVVATALLGACGRSIPDRCDGSPFVCPAEWATGHLRTTATPYTLDTDTANDPVTGLMWQRELPKAMHRWSAARDYCEALTLGGHDDWRLPSRLELLMLVDYPTSETPPATSPTQRFGPPMIDASAFPGTPPAMFWTASSRGGASHPVAWVVDFGTGLVDEEDIDLLLPRTRCVRTEKAAAATDGGSVATASTMPEPATGFVWEHYVVTSTTVREPATGLVWQRHPDDALSYAAAEAYCASLRLDGQGGYRLPTLKEAMSIVSAVAADKPALDSNAFEVPKWMHSYGLSLWTSTPWSIPGPGREKDANVPGRRYTVALGERGRIDTRPTREDPPYNYNRDATLCVRN